VKLSIPALADLVTVAKFVVVIEYDRCLVILDERLRLRVVVIEVVTSGVSLMVSVAETVCVSMSVLDWDAVSVTFMLSVMVGDSVVLGLSVFVDVLEGWKEGVGLSTGDSVPVRSMELVEVGESVKLGV
jgi:uncharacterized membrane protein